MMKQKAYNLFKEKLFASKLKPGQFVTQSELTKLLDVPVGALREALQKLEAEELVRVIPQRGIQIAEINVKLVKEAFQLRMFLEKEAVRYFTQNAPDEVIEKLESEAGGIIERAKNEISEQLKNDAQRFDFAFHETIVDAVGNSLLSNVYRVNYDKIKVIWLETVYPPERIIPAMEEHLEVIRAMKGREPETAAAAMEKHLIISKNRALGI
ncbi:MAG: GntR family transcriptional regulator [Desulfobacterales bacterium]|nr:MAG: GntR family transcriptional regulator [Desulfobacterales bacterium]